MDVKEVKKTNNPEAASSKAAERSSKTSETGPSNPRLSLAAVSVDKIANKNDKISVREDSPRRANEVREDANKAINQINLSLQAAEDIRDLFGSVEGIVSQASEPATSSERKAVLEKEANDLLGEVKRIGSESESNLSSSKLSDDVRIDIEKELAPLRKILPDGAQESFGVNSVDFSTEEAIINTRVEVERAQRQLLDLTNSVSEASDKLRSIVNSLDVAAENTEAAESELRDLDEALKLGAEIKREINADPELALGSASKLREDSIELLK